MEKRTFNNNKVLEYGGDKRALFRLVDNLAGKEKSPILPKRSTPQDVAADFSSYFSTKVSKIRSSLDASAAGSPLLCLRS